jgi:hypothetical protein
VVNTKELFLEGKAAFYTKVVSQQAFLSFKSIAPAYTLTSNVASAKGVI